MRRICCETGLGGTPIDPLFADRELFADFLTRYYTDFEPESALVAESGGRVVGYLTACLRPRLHARVQPRIALSVALRAVWRLLRGRYGEASRAFLYWAAFRARRELPRGPAAAAHFHLNMLPGHRDRFLGIRLGLHFLESLPARGVERVWGRAESSEGGPSFDPILARYGFRLLERRPTTRRRPVDERPVEVAVFLKEIAGSGDHQSTGRRMRRFWRSR